MSAAPTRRLAWFTPLPPARSGIAAYSAELVPRLAESYTIEVFVEGAPLPDRRGAEPRNAGRFRILDAHDFVWRHARAPYDLVVYQLGNETCHEYMWPYLVRYPGLVVLHDGQLHHARARALLRRGRLQDYRAELAFEDATVPRGVAEVGALGLLGSLQYFWPLLRVPVTAARRVGVHSVWLADEIRARYPEARVETIRMGVADPLASAPATRAEGTDSRPNALQPDRCGSLVRARHGVPADAGLFVAFGRVTPEKRVGPVVRALAGLAGRGMRVHLLLVGEVADYYDVRAEIARAGATGLVTITGYVAEDELPAYLTAADVCLCLRWPTARESSASWLRCLAAGKPTIVTDLAHTVDVPAIDPRDWSVLPPARPDADEFAIPGGDARPDEPVCVAIDILDEDHSLALAVDCLARDAGLRARLGDAARRWFERHHTLAHMVEDYRRVIEETCTSEPTERPALPAHLLADWSERARTLLGELGLSLDCLDATPGDG